MALAPLRIGPVALALLCTVTVTATCNFFQGLDIDAPASYVATDDGHERDTGTRRDVAANDTREPDNGTTPGDPQPDDAPDVPGCVYRPSGEVFSVRGTDRTFGPSYVWGQGSTVVHFCNELACGEHVLQAVDGDQTPRVIGLSPWRDREHFIGTQHTLRIIRTDPSTSSELRLLEVDAFIDEEFCVDEGCTDIRQVTVTNYRSGVRFGDWRVALGDCEGSLCTLFNHESAVFIVRADGSGDVRKTVSTVEPESRGPW